MNFGSVYHRTTEQYCYARNQEELVITLLTGYDVKKVFINWGDPFSAGILGGNELWSGEEMEIKDPIELEHHLLWKIVLKPKYKRCKYYFKLRTKEEEWIYVEDGFYQEKQLKESGRMIQYFIMPWMNERDIGTVPEWVEHTIWYQIFPERFCNGEPLNDPSHVKLWKMEKTNYLDLYGGDLQGIIKRLPYLHQLGITGIYLTPICEALSNHKYDTTDYKKIDPMFGTEETMKELVHKAHDLGIRIMMDGVFNHTGKEFKPWKDVLLHGEKSRYKDWFMIHEFPVEKDKRDTRDGSYFSFAFAGGMPKLNTNHEEVIDFIKDVCTYWIQEYDIDGIRFDVGNEVSHYFLKELRKHLLAIKSDLYLLGEIWHDSTQWLFGDEYDGVMNYPLTSSINDFWKEELTAKQLEHRINRCMNLYREQNQKVMFNLLDSHDTDRLRTRCGSEEVFYQQMAVLFTMAGSACIYYGTEIGMEGGHDPDCRRCMPWEDIEQGAYQKEQDAIKTLIAIRKQEEDCKALAIEFLYPKEEAKQERVIHYKKGNGLYVLLNATKAPISIKEWEISKEKIQRLFQWNCEEETIGVNGTLIYKVL